MSVAYRAEIDGLRAIAILAVLIFHLDAAWLPGGFVGVDVFFAISGFLITSQLLASPKDQPLDVLGFYQRRIARIVPSLAAMAVATLAASVAIYDAQNAGSAGANFAATALSVANLKLMFQGDYFEVPPDTQPFMHCWSLSLEEQFYLLLPVAMLFLKRQSNTVILLGLGAVACASCAACVTLTSYRPVWAFYLLPTRAWELLAGCIVACMPAHLFGRETRCGLPTLGLLAIAIAFGITPDNKQFPGLWPLLPVIGAACVLKPGKVDLAHKMLSRPPLVLVGRMSYSLYLWHWPVFCLIDYSYYSAPPALRLLSKVALTAALAACNFWLLEGPMRRVLNQRNRRLLAYGFLAAFVVCGIQAGAWVRMEHYVTASMHQVARGGVRFKATSTPEQDAEIASRSVVLMGDSTASVFGRLIRKTATHFNATFTVLSVAAGDPLPPLAGPAGALWQSCLSVIQRERPDCVVISCAWQVNGNADRLSVALDQLAPFVGKVVLLDAPPSMPERATRQATRRGSVGPFVEDDDVRTKRLAANQRLRDYMSDRVIVVDVAQHFEDADGKLRTIDPLGRQLYHDRNHVSDAGANLSSKDIQEAIWGESINRPARPGSDFKRAKGD